MNTRLLARGKRFKVFEDEPHGYRVLRLKDGKEATFYGDDSCERFLDHYNGDECLDYDEDENATAADEIGEWCEREGEL